MATALKLMGGIHVAAGLIEYPAGSDDTGRGIGVACGRVHEHRVCLDGEHGNVGGT